MAVLRKMLSSVNFYLGATITLVYSVQEVNRLIDKLAETQTARNSVHYVAIRTARGHYKRPDGIELLINDYKFYKTISKFHK